ncbi:MAG: response regulator [Proteobacteria bacterium]|nr:response regulator [Pseudomonadota bacterium]
MLWQSPQRPDVHRVIVADDDRDVLRLISAALEHSGYEVHTVTSGSELQDVLVKHAIYGGPEHRPADVVISDIRMPGCSGLEVLADLRGRAWAPPVIVISGAMDDALRGQAQRMGASAVLSKPLNLETLRSEVDAAVGLKRGGEGSRARAAAEHRCHLPQA